MHTAAQSTVMLGTQGHVLLVQAVHFSQSFDPLPMAVEPHVCFYEWDTNVHLVEAIVARLPNVVSLKHMAEQSFQLAGNAVPAMSALQALTLLGPVTDGCAVAISSMLRQLTELTWNLSDSRPDRHDVDEERETDGGASALLSQLHVCRALDLTLMLRRDVRGDIIERPVGLIMENLTRTAGHLTSLAIHRIDKVHG